MTDPIEEAARPTISDEDWEYLHDGETISDPYALALVRNLLDAYADACEERDMLQAERAELRSRVEKAEQALRDVRQLATEYALNAETMKTAAAAHDYRTIAARIRAALGEGSSNPEPAPEACSCPCHSGIGTVDHFVICCDSPGAVSSISDDPKP